jgi:hypothetical protein
LAHVSCTSIFHQSSQAEAKCELNDSTYGYGEDCNSLKINGADAAINGYPDVQVKYTFQVCNYNESTNKINLLGDSTFQFFYPVVNAGEEKLILNKNLGGQVLGPGQCQKEEATTIVSTDRASYYMKSLLQGPSKTESGGPVDDGYCYAYAYNIVDFKYDYGLGDCDVSVSEYSTTFVLRVSLCWLCCVHHCLAFADTSPIFL